MEATVTTSIDQKINELERKAQRIDDSKNIEKKTGSATSSFQKLRKRFKSTEEAAEDLAFYVEVLERVFGGERPGSVDVTLSLAQDKVDITDEELLEAAESLGFTDHYEDLRSVESDIESACRQVRKEIEESYQEPWRDDLTSARELNRIIGGQNDDFNRLIRDIQLFLTQEVHDPQNSPQSLATKWDSLTQQWEKNTGKHGWDAFRDQHGLAPKSIDELKQFSSQDTVRLSDLSLRTIEEIKTVDELESALEVRIKS